MTEPLRGGAGQRQEQGEGEGGARERQIRRQAEEREAMSSKAVGRKRKYDGEKLTPAKRLKIIAEILEARDAELVATDGLIPQEPIFLRRIYLLAIGSQKER